MGLMTFAALATVALIIGIALAKPPSQQQASLAPDPPSPAPAAPLVDAAPDLAPATPPAPPQEAAPAPAHDAAPTPPQDAAPTSQPAEPTPAPTRPAEEAPADTAPVSTPALDVNPATDYVRAFYADLEQRRFRAAWPRLAEDLRASYGSYETWASGFDNTVRQSASDLVAKAAGPATVRVSLTLTAVDRDKHDCEVTRRYAVEWRLDLMGGKWRALHAEGKPLDEPPTGVAASCSAEQPASVSQNED